MTTVYLAGPMTGMTWNQARAWRKEAKWALSDLGIRVLDPLRGFEQLAVNLDQAIPQMETLDFASPLQSPAFAYARDLNDVARSDVVLVNMTGASRVSIGTCIEIGAAVAQHKPIFLVMEPHGNIHEHFFITHPAIYRTDDILDATAAIAEWVL